MTYLQFVGALALTSVIVGLFCMAGSCINDGWKGCGMGIAWRIGGFCFGGLLIAIALLMMPLYLLIFRAAQ